MRFIIRKDGTGWTWAFLEDKDVNGAFAYGAKTYRTVGECHRALDRLLHHAAWSRITVQNGGSENELAQKKP